MKLFATEKFPTLPTETLLQLLPRFKEEKTRSFATLICTLIAIILFTFFAITPTLSTIADLHKQIDDTTFVDQQLTQKIAALTSLQQQYTSLTPSLPFIFSAVPESANIPVLFGQIQAIAFPLPIQLLRIQSFPLDISAAKPLPTGYNSFAFIIDATGSQQGVTAFLNQMSNFNRLITIDSVSLVKASQTTDTMRVSIKGKGYYKQSL